MDVLREWAAGTYLGRSLYADEGFNSLERHLALMDKFGVEKEVINYGNLLVPAAKTGKLPMEEVVKTVNNYIAGFARSPARFAPAADPFGRRGGVARLTKVEKLGLFGISLSTNAIAPSTIRSTSRSSNGRSGNMLLWATQRGAAIVATGAGKE
jgi:hypothetical protein